DANGQTSLSYLDQEGRVIATALAGTGPANLLPVDGQPSAQSFHENLLTNNNALDQSEEMVSTTTILVTASTNYSFNYSLGGYCYTNTCTPVCTNCTYDLILSITDEDGNPVTLTETSPSTTTVTGPITATGITSTSGTYSYNVTLSPGSYTVSKIVQVHPDAGASRANYIADQYAAINTTSQCVTVPVINPESCTINCQTICTGTYFTGNYTSGSDSIYVNDSGVVIPDASRTTVAWGLLTACRASLCYPSVTQAPDECTLHLQLLTADMSPGGQYFDNTPGKYKYDSLNNAILDTTYNINLWMSTTSGISSTMLGTINSTYSTSYTTWDQVRANWIPAYGTTLVQYHPEYCLYKYYCVSRTCGVMGGVGGGASYDPTSINQYETSMYSTEDNSTASTDGFFNPAGVTLSTSHTPTNAYCPYSPSGSSPDPFYNCAANVACSEDAQQLMQGYLENYFWDPGTSAFYSIWYVLDDPDGIHLLTPDPTNILRTYIQNLLGTSTTSGLIGSGAGQVSKYNYFRSSYLFYRNLITFKQAPNCVSSGTTSGYTLRYPQDSVFISFNLCSPTTTASNLSTYSNNNMILSCESNCATYADGWIAQLSSCSLTSTQLSNIRANLISVCAANCDNPSLSTNNYNGTAGCSTCPGVNYPSTGTPLTVFHDFADVVSYFSSSSCTTTITFSPAAPSPPTVTYDQGICSCENLSNFINTYNLDPTHIAGTDMPTANLIAAMFAQASGAVTSYTGTQIQSWISDCAASTTTISMSTLTAASFPTLLTCPAPASTSTADIVAAAKVAECQQQNLQTSMDNSAQQFLANLKSLADKFVSKYDSVCLTNLSVAGTETFTMDHTELIFQYTLYYYDQAGNLIKTIPPKGFVPLTATQITNTQNYRAALSGSSFQYPAHTMVTDYMYNSLQQLIQQTTPDAGQTNFFYDEFGRLVASQNANQYVAGTYSYTLYDYLGRIAEVGQIATSTALTEAIAKDATVGAFASWIGGGTRSQVTSSYYDDYLGSTISDNTVYNYFSNCTSSSITTPGYLRNRVSSTTYKETYSSSIMTYDNASHYSYDQHGNVNVLLQETGELNASGNGLKRIEYAYDLVSGNVNQVHYSDLNCSTYNQKNFYHNYYYDLDNRLASVYTSLDNVLWDKDSKYFYYLTGALNRTELGDKQVQGLDYAYTINGWLKGVNSASMVSSADIGKDAYYSGSSNNLNANFGTDAMGFTLGYFKANSGATAPYGNDYTAVNTSFTSGTSNFEVNQGTGNAFAAAIVDLFNGNISNMVTGLMDQTQHLLNTQGKAYRYDQLNRIKSSTSFEDTGIPTSNTWTTTFGLTGAIWSEDFSYDFNGNLNQVNRKGNLTTLSGRNMDNFTYYYYTTSGAQITATATPSGSDQFTNKLAYVTDNTLNTPSYADDIDNESSSNYTYDKIGNLIGDVSEGIQEIDWTVYNKVKRVIRTAAANCNPDLEFRYDASGNRIVKIVKPHNTTTPYALTTQDQWTYTYYVHDAQGNVMSTYTKKYTVIGTNHFNEIYNLNELDIFGSS
ncbi:MAG TPA: hypothetical protein VNZ86_06720, partial [Bacteroidia bacterium]|nr:hypothetical protein [Bacteroidia bacterium]